MDRTTKTFQTPSGRTVVMFDYITGREMQDVSRAGQGTEGTFDTKLAASNRAVEILVREFDGSTEKMMDRILDLPYPDYAAIVEEVSSIIDPSKKS